MALSDNSFFIDDASVTSLQARVPAAVFNSGLFGGGSNAGGIGISTDNPGLEESLPSWTLLDQHGNARIAQISQMIGGNADTPRVGDQEFTWDKSQPSYSDNGAASSGGQDGTLPDATIRLVAADDLPTAEEKEADSNLDGSLSFPALGATLNSLAVGWETGV